MIATVLLVTAWIVGGALAFALAVLVLLAGALWLRTYRLTRRARTAATTTDDEQTDELPIQEDER